MALFRAQARVLSFYPGQVVDIDLDDPQFDPYIAGAYLVPVEIEQVDNGAEGAKPRGRVRKSA